MPMLEQLRDMPAWMIGLISAVVVTIALAITVPSSLRLATRLERIERTTRDGVKTTIIFDGPKEKAVESSKAEVNETASIQPLRR
jgi:hypothetical protein